MTDQWNEHNITSSSITESESMHKLEPFMVLREANCARQKAIEFMEKRSFAKRSADEISTFQHSYLSITSLAWYNEKNSLKQIREN